MDPPLLRDGVGLGGGDALATNDTGLVLDLSSLFCLAVVYLGGGKIDKVKEE